MKKIILNSILSAGLLVIISFAACSVYYPSYSDYDRSADFKTYKTFAWLPYTDSARTPYNNQIIRNNTQNYFTHCFGLRGYKIDLTSPDILLQMIIKSEKQEKLVTTTNTTYPSGYYNSNNYNSNPYYYPYPNNYYYNGSYNYQNYQHQGWTTTTTQKVEYMKSSITLNAFDRKQNKLVWTSTAEGDIYDADNIEGNLHPAVYDILDNYPIAPIHPHKKPTH